MFVWCQALLRNGVIALLSYDVERVKVIIAVCIVFIVVSTVIIGLSIDFIGTSSILIVAPIVLIGVRNVFIGVFTVIIRFGIDFIGTFSFYIRIRIVIIGVATYIIGDSLVNNLILISFISKMKYRSFELNPIIFYPDLNFYGVRNLFVANKNQISSSSCS